MTIQHRIGLAISAAALTFGLGFTPAAYAADSMSMSAMHKHMKKHKGGMKGDAMKGDAMKGDAMKSDEMSK